MGPGCINAGIEECSSIEEYGDACPKMSLEAIDLGRRALCGVWMASAVRSYEFLGMDEMVWRFWRGGNV